ncbi:MAG: hypothetical protein ACKOZW_01320 [Cyanobium sp.]
MPLFRLNRSVSQAGRPFVLPLPGALLAGCLALGAVLPGPAAAEKNPYNNSAVASSWCTAYPWYPNSAACASVNPARPFRALLAIVDSGFGPEDPVSARLNFQFDFEYDPALLSFDSRNTTLLCDLRAPGSAPFCPQLPPGQGTQPLGEVTDTFSVDQTGLTIREDATGLPKVSLSYEAPAQLSLGQRNFLALAFALRRPLGLGTTVTYSPTVLPDATFATTGFFCSDASGAEVDCDSAVPSLSWRLNPVPSPLALGALPALWQARRRLRQRRR